MFCKNCGKEIEDGKELCDSCAAAEEKTVAAEPEVATQVYSEGEVQKSQEVPVTETTTSNTNTNAGETKTSASKPSDAKSKMAAGLLGIFLGAFGVHNFYLGFTGKAVAQLLITILSCGILSPVSAIWGLIEGILVLTGSINADGNGNPLVD